AAARRVYSYETTETWIDTGRLDTFSARFYINRTSRRHRHYRHSGGNAFARAGEGAAKNPRHLLHEQRQAVDVSLANVCARSQRLSSPEPGWRRRPRLASSYRELDKSSSLQQA